MTCNFPNGVCCEGNRACCPENSICVKLPNEPGKIGCLNILQHPDVRQALRAGVDDLNRPSESSEISRGVESSESSARSIPAIVKSESASNAARNGVALRTAPGSSTGSSTKVQLKLYVCKYDPLLKIVVVSRTKCMSAMTVLSTQLRHHWLQYRWHHR